MPTAPGRHPLPILIEIETLAALALSGFRRDHSSRIRIPGERYRLGDQTGGAKRPSKVAASGPYFRQGQAVGLARPLWRASYAGIQAKPIMNRELHRRVLLRAGELEILTFVVGLRCIAAQCRALRRRWAAIKIGPAAPIIYFAHVCVDQSPREGGQFYSALIESR